MFHASLRAKVDVSGIKRKLELGGDRIWGDDEARTSNVAITRPSHDAWGIRKVSLEHVSCAINVTTCDAKHFRMI